MNIQSEIIKTIDMLISKRLEKTVIPKDVPSIIKGITPSKKYVVVIDGVDYTVPCGTNLNNLTIGTAVWVHLPNSATPSTAFILARR